MPILGILASNSKPYSLLATIYSTQSWTVPSDISTIAVFLVGGGAFGEAGGSSAGKGGYGGGGSAGVAFKDYTVIPGTSYTVAIGATGTIATESRFYKGSTDIAQSGAGYQQTFFNGYLSGVSGQAVTGQIGGSGGAARSSNGSGNPGSAGAAAATLTLNLKGLGDVSIKAGASGPGGGGGARAVGTFVFGSGGSSAVNDGAVSGFGGEAYSGANFPGDYPYANPGVSGSRSSANPGDGGPGGGGGGYALNTRYGYSASGIGGSGYPGQSGVVYIYGY